MYIPLGMVMDGLAMLFLTLPIVFPVAVQFGFDPVWLGVILTFIVEIALITPPVRMNTYVVHGVTKVPLTKKFRGMLHFFLMIVMCLALMYIFPQIVLVLILCLFEIMKLNGLQSIIRF